MAYREVFLWLSASLSIVSKAAPGTPPMLPEVPRQMTRSEVGKIIP
jgi:uncharacterized protein YegL